MCSVGASGFLSWSVLLPPSVMQAAFIHPEPFQFTGASYSLKSKQMNKKLDEHLQEWVIRVSFTWIHRLWLIT
jgi:hypothetical protein